MFTINKTLNTNYTDKLINTFNCSCSAQPGFRRNWWACNPRLYGGLRRGSWWRCNTLEGIISKSLLVDSDVDVDLDGCGWEQSWYNIVMQWLSSGYNKPCSASAISDRKPVSSTKLMGCTPYSLMLVRRGAFGEEEGFVALEDRKTSILVCLLSHAPP